MNRHLPGLRCRGFTIMELMVVLVLIGIILSMTTLSVDIGGGQGRELEEEAQRLVTLIRMARDETILRAEDWQVVFYEDAYKFQRVKKMVGDQVDNKGELLLETSDVDNKVFRKRTLSGYKLNVFLEGTNKKLGTAKQDEEDGKIIGRVGLSPSGELTPFELNIRTELLEHYFIITGNEFGDLSLKNSKDL